MNSLITTSKVPLSELQSRLARFRAQMDHAHPDWELAVFFSKINLYYFTGTMQDGLLFVPRKEEPAFWIRRSHERAHAESLFPWIKPMSSFRDARSSMPNLPRIIYLETESVPLALWQRFHKHFPFAQTLALDSDIAAVRSVKSPFELALLERAGQIHRKALEEHVPSLLREGMSEAELACELFSVLVREGHHGIARFGMFDTEIVLGHVAFGESSIYPTYFNGPGGNLGLCPAVPLLGNRERKLAKGDLIYIDIGCGVEGYHTDKTMTYMFGRPLPEEAIAIHQQCVGLQRKTATLLKPGAIPSQIYKTIIEELSPGFLDNFMGYGTRRVRFLGHGIGLVVDETPILAEGFDDPLQEGMTLAVEPKKGIANIGMVGIEDTFLVTPNGGRSLTGDHQGLLLVN